MDTNQVLALTDLAWEHLDRYPDSCRLYCQRAYALGCQLEYDYGMGLALETEGMAQHNSLQWEAATNSFLRAAGHYEAAGAKTAFAGLYNNLGLLLLDTKDTLRALDYLERSLAYEVTAGDTADIVASQINICVLYSATGQLDRAEAGLRNILPLARSIGALQLTNVIRGNLAVIEQRRGRYAVAAEQLRALLPANPDTLHHVQFYISTITSLTEALLRLGQLAEADRYLERASCAVERTGDRRYLLPILKLKVELAAARKAPAEQVRHLSRYHAVKDSLAATENLRHIAVLNADYEYLQQREEITRLQLEQTRKERRLERERILYGGALLIAILVTWLVFRGYRRKLRAEKTARARQAAELAFKSRQLHTFARHLAERNSRVQELETAFTEQTANHHQLTAQLSSQAILTEADWCAFQQLFHEVHPGFLPRMRRDALNYTEGELRLAALLRLGLDRQTIANILGISSESVRKNVYRLERKIGLPQRGELTQYLSKYLAGGK